MFLADVVVASWSLTQKVAGSSPFTVTTNVSVTEFAEFSENIYEILPRSPLPTNRYEPKKLPFKPIASVPTTS